MVNSCSAIGCTSRYVKGTGISFHRFPIDEKRKALWIRALKRKDWMPSSTSSVCGQHFQTGKPSYDEGHPDYIPNVFRYSKGKIKSAKNYEKRKKTFNRILTAKNMSQTPTENSNTAVSLQYQNIIPASMFQQARLKSYSVPSCFSPVLSTDGIKNSLQKKKTADSELQFGEINRENESGRKKPKCHICSKEFFTFSHALEHLKTKHASWFRNLEYISCCIAGCQSKSPRKIEYNTETGEENILMFPVPHTDKLFNLWKKALKGTETELTWDDHICERHFLENDIERYYRTKTADGDIIKIQKKLPTLKPDAVPIKFLKLPSYLIAKDSSIKLQSDSQNSVVINFEGNLSDNSKLTLNSCDSVNSIVDEEIEIHYDSSVDSLANHSDSSIKSVPGQISHKKKCLLYNELVKSIQLVKKPSEFWSVVCTDQFIIFARWNNKFIAEKRIVIDSSFIIRVFLKDWEIEMTDLVDITSTDDVSSLLEKVENYNMDITC